MKNILYIVFPVLIIIGQSGCDTAGGVDDEIFARGADAALASWVSTPDGDILLSNPASAASFSVEFIDESGGSTVSNFTLNVSDGTNSGVVFTSSSFSANSDGNQGVSGSYSLNTIMDALGTTVADYEEGDEFEFAATITRDGVVYPAGNAAMFLNAVRQYSIALPLETVVVAGVSADSARLNANSTEYVVMAFENDFGVALKTHPTIEILSGGGAFGDVEVVAFADPEDEDNLGKDSVYRALYTPTTEGPVTFRIIGASAIGTDVFTNEPDTSENFFIVDLTNPTVVGDNSGQVTAGQRYSILLDEPVGDVKLMVDFLNVDDDEDGLIDAADTDGDAVEGEVAFDGDLIDFTFGWKDEDGQVTLTLEAFDRAGNPLTLDPGTASVTLVPTP